MPEFLVLLAYPDVFLFSISPVSVVNGGGGIVKEGRRGREREGKFGKGSSESSRVFGEQGMRGAGID